MNAFECNVTPTRVRNAKSRNEDREPSLVVLGPFTPKTIVQFDEIPVSKTARRLIIVENPYKENLKVTGYKLIIYTIFNLKLNLQVSTTKLPKPELNVCFEWTIEEIPASSKIQLEVVWKPLKVVSCREILQLTDNYGNKKDIAIILKSIELKKAGSRKLGSSNHPQRLKFKTKTPSPAKSVSRTTFMKKTTIYKEYSEEIHHTTKEPMRESLAPSTRTFASQNAFNCDSTRFSRVENEYKYTDKENTPVTPANASALFDSIKFTPATETKSKSSSKLEYLSSLPTPVGISRDNMVFTETATRRKLENDISPDVDSRRQQNENKENSQVIIHTETSRQVSFESPVRKTTHLVSTPPSMPIISENEAMTNCTTPERITLQKTFNVAKQSLETSSYNVRMSESLREMSFNDDDVPVQKLRNNQGSMPNLNEMTAVTPIENNRYFFQKDRQYNQQKVQNLSMESSVSNTDFRDMEICAQSSRFNINEVGLAPNELAKRTDSPKSVLSTPPRYHTKNNHNFQVPQPPRMSKKQPQLPTLSSTGNGALISQSLTSLSTLSLVSSTSTQSMPSTPKKGRDYAHMYNAESHFQTYINPDPFAASTTCDPFLSSTMYLDEKSVDRIEKQFKKWLNALVTIPAELNSEVEKVDVGKLFNEVQNKELKLAPTRELVSSKYYKTRLDSLRAAGIKLYTSEQMRMPLTKLTVNIEKKSLEIRADRMIHLDLVLQRNLLELLLCFNPLWLRIGLEVVFGVQIELNSNQDVLGLSRFIITKMFKDPYLAEKYSKYSQQKEYVENLKKFTLKKFLFVIYFLDHAKTQRLIKHNPCLFVKKAPYKETNEILKKFASLVIANFGDILRYLKRLDYVLSHKQTYIDEFDYAFNNLAIDLRDGVRLNRVMEIILLRDDLTKMVRAPAISRLQKVYNNDCALKALQSADYQLNGDITAKDIADGHREKTLSMLWQIIYKFRAPRFNAAAITIQKFWRQKWLMVVIERRIKKKEEMRLTNAATVLQKIYRGNKSRQATKIHRQQRVEATIFIQKNVRRFLTQIHYQKQVTSIVRIQSWYRRVVTVREVRSLFLQQKTSTVVIQTWWRRQLLSRKLIAASNLIRCLRSSTIVVQTYWRALSVGRKQRQEYLKMKESTVKIQRWLRSCLIMKSERRSFLTLRTHVVKVQEIFRGKLLMKLEQKSFQMMKKSTINVQRRYRAQVLMRHERQEFVVMKQATIRIQQQFRATIAMKQQQMNYQLLKESVITVQKRYRATLEMRQCRNEYQLMRGAALTIQQQYRSVLMMRIERKKFQECRSATINVQRQWRARIEMKKVRKSFVELKEATIAVQQRFRANQMMKQEKTYYQKLLKCTIKLQQKFRATKAMQKQCLAFYTLQYYTMLVQRSFRATITMRKTREEYQRLKRVTITVQRLYRAKLAMKKAQMDYLKLRQVTITIQKYYRGFQLMNKETQSYQRLRECTIKMQRIYRGKIMMKNEVHELNVKKEAILKIQRYWRATTEMRIQKVEYHRELTFVVIQQRFRATQVMKYEMERFVIIRKSVLVIQRHFQATMMMRKEQKQFSDLKNAAVVIQQRFRANLMMRKERDSYRSMKMAVSVVETRYLANCEMRVERSRFVEMRQSAVTIQRTYRRFKEATDCRQRFINLKRVTIRLQTHIRGFIARKRYQELFTPEMIEARLRSSSARIIQASWRGFVVRRKKENRPLKAIAKRLQIAKQNADPTQTLGFKLKMSINFIIGKFNAMEAISVLVKLEYISRTIPSMLIGDAAFVSAFCYGLMAQAIRSEIDKQVIELCSCIILNLGRYMTTKEDAFQEQGLMTIAQMLLRWCDKDCGIFNTLCTLIWVFAHCDTKKKMIRKFMMQQDGSYVMSQIKMQVKRKENMRRNCRKPIGFQSISLHKYQKDYQLLQQNQHTSQYSSGFITPAMLQQCKQMPSFAPDYGVVKTKPYIFYSSVFAYDQILKILDIHLL
ncbi:unnamed protein product [Diamesa tonsa]